MVRLSAIIEAMETPSGISAYYDRENDKVEYVAEYDDLKEERAIRKLIYNDRGGRFIHIDRNELRNEGWMDMKCFADSIEDEKIRNAAYDAIHRKGAFGRFRSLMIRSDLINRWYSFQDERIADSAREWCADNEVCFDDDIIKNR